MLIVILCLPILVLLHMVYSFILVLLCSFPRTCLRLYNSLLKYTLEIEVSFQLSDNGIPDIHTCQHCFKIIVMDLVFLL